MRVQGSGFRVQEAASRLRRARKGLLSSRNPPPEPRTLNPEPRRDAAFLALLLLPLLGVMGWAATRREPEVVLSRFVTSLKDRTPNQIHNVALATRSINGRWLRPGEAFSFNRAVGAWSSDSGYKRAPVSYDGELVPSWGGGVCQTSTTLYNAAALAGLGVVERHRHRWLTHYALPGRDAAVAYSNIDLKLRNDFPWPVRLEGEVRGGLVEFRVVARERLPDRWEFRQRVESVAEPVVLRQPWQAGMPSRSVRNPGRRGCRVLTYRVRLRAGREVARELLSDDAYPAMNRLLLTQR
jgi:vancomycin resistance protein VanW